MTQEKTYPMAQLHNGSSLHTQALPCSKAQSRKPSRLKSYFIALTAGLLALDANAQVTYVGAGRADQVHSDEVQTVTAPSNTAAGDLMVLFLGGSNSRAVTELSGWTPIRTKTNENDPNDLNLTALYKVYESGASRSFSIPPRQQAFATIVSLRGVNLSNPIVDNEAFFNWGGSETDKGTSIAPSLNSLSGGMLLCGFMYDDPYRDCTVNNMTGIYSYAYSGGGDSDPNAGDGLTTAYRSTQGGPTGTHQAVASNDVTDGGGAEIGMALSFRPAISTETLGVNQSLNTGQLMVSSNGQYQLSLQGDGNLVLRHREGTSLWASSTKGRGAIRLSLQADGNLALYNATNTPVWTSGTTNNAATTLRLNDDGSLVTYNGSTAVWSVNVPAVPSPWVTQDIGDFRLGLAGSAFYSASTYTLVGSGEQMGGDKNDHFRFVHQFVSGNFTVTARVKSVRATDPTAKAGVMIRSTLNPNSAAMAIIVTPSNGVFNLLRTATNRTGQLQSPIAAAAPYWVRITRDGTTFRTYYSGDGITWTQARSTTIAQSQIGIGAYVGLVMSSEDSSTTGAAVFENVSVTP